MFLETNGLFKIYRTEDIETTALRDVSIQVREGEFLAVMGPSGCGKSTLLGILGMLDTASNGKYLFQGENLAVAPPRRLSQIRRESVGFIFQNFNLIDDLTIRENVELPLLYAGVNSAERRAKSSEILDYVGISHRQNHRPKQLSGGQQQRAAVARALICKPKLILADEPTGNLDSQSSNAILDLLTELNGQGSTIIMVTHSAEQTQVAGRLIKLHDGAVHTDTDISAGKKHDVKDGTVSKSSQ